MKSLVLSLALLVSPLTGCASWNVDAFGYHMQASDKYQTSSGSSSSSGKLSTEEKWGVIIVLGVAIGAGIAIAAAAN